MNYFLTFFGKTIIFADWVLNQKNCLAPIVFLNAKECKVSPDYSDVGLEDGDDNVVIEVDVLDDQLHAALELVQVAQDHQRVQRVDQR